MSTYDVPGAVAEHHDVLAMGCWAEHDDGSLIFVQSTEGGSVVYMIFDTAQDPAVEYRDAMPEAGFKERFSWDPDSTDDDNIRWTWHDKTPFPWDRIMDAYPPGQKHSSARAQLTAAQQIAKSLHLRAGAVHYGRLRPGRTILGRLNEALEALRK